MGEKVQGISINGRYKINGEDKSCIGNEDAKELICMTHGHELSRVGNAGGVEYRMEWNKLEKQWKNLNSIINKMYF